jgi:hypothetical protein
MGCLACGRGGFHIVTCGEGEIPVPGTDCIEEARREALRIQGDLTTANRCILDALYWSNIIKEFNRITEGSVKP